MEKAQSANPMKLPPQMSLRLRQDRLLQRKLKVQPMMINHHIEEAFQSVARVATQLPPPLFKDFQVFKFSKASLF